MAYEYDDMLQSLPVAYRRDAWVAALLSALGAQDEAQRQAARDTAAQLFPDTMTWALAIEERVAGLTPGQAAAAEERRSALIAKWRSMTGKCDLELIQRVCDAWDKGEVAAVYTGGVLVLTFVSLYGVPARLDALQAAIREVAPAHIPVQYVIRYRLWREAAALTWGALASHSWHDVKEGEL